MLMSQQARLRLSKFLALVLRHEAERFDITLDEDGYTDVAQVWSLIQERFGDRYTQADLLAVVAGDKDGKVRYQIQDGKIRALFGHSKGVRAISYQAIEPPLLLYHGTVAEAIPAIQETGLQAQRRQYVHLTNQLNRAERVAQRHGGNILILQVRALEAFQEGVVFYHPEPEHYLARLIPPQFIHFPTA